MRRAAVHEAMADGVRHNLRLLMLQPVQKRGRRRFVAVKIGGSVEKRDAAAVDDPHLTARLTDPLDLGREHQPLCPIHVVERRFEARRAGIDRQDSQTAASDHTSLYSGS
jgi:hypothetical protein